MAQEIGAGLQDIGQFIEKANLLGEKTRAQNHLDTRLADIETARSVDPDITETKHKQYLADIQKAKSEASAFIKLPREQSLFSLEVDNKAKIAELRIQSDYTKKIIDKNKAEFETRHNTVLKNKFVSAVNPKDRQSAILEDNNMIAEMVDAGYLTREEAAKKIIERDKEWKMASVLTDIANDKSTKTNQSIVLEELQKGKEGIFSFLDDLQREEAIKKSRMKINDNKQYETEIKVDKRLDVLKQLADGKIDWQNDDLIRKITIEDPELGEAIKKGTDTLFIPDLNEEAFVEATQKVFSASTKEEIGTYLMNVLNENGNKEIGRERFAILTNAAVERAKELKTTSESQPITPDSKQIETDSAIKSILNIGNPVMNLGNVILNFFKNITSGNSIKDAHDNAIKSEVNRTNPLSVKYKIGDTITNPQGISGEVVGFNDNGSPIIKRKCQTNKTQ